MRTFNPVFALLIIAFCITILAPGVIYAQPGTVLFHQKISDTQGGFVGILDDDDNFGHSVADIGDLDGDGVTDIVVGAIGDDDKSGGGSPVQDRGAVWILFMNTNGTVKSFQKISDTQGNFSGGLLQYDNFGWSVASLGDLDGDLICDIAVGAVGDDDGGSRRGAIYILFLNANGTVKSHQKISDTDGGFATPLDNYDEFGSAIANIGDLDGDGVTDIVVGASRDDDGGTNSVGAVYILFLNTNGTVKAEQKISEISGGFGVDMDDYDEFGFSVAALGDLDGDNVEDICVGAYADYDGGQRRGSVYNIFLNTDGTVKSQQKISNLAGAFTGTLDNNDRLGTSISSGGDMDGDGILDIIVGARGDDDGGLQRGAIWHLFLNANATVKSYQKVSNTAGSFTGVLDDNDYFGFSVSTIGDLDVDGSQDMVVGAYLDDDGGTNRGAVWTLFSDASTLPIELISFTAVPLNQEAILLEWVTASAINNDFFNVE